MTRITWPDPTETVDYIAQRRSAGGYDTFGEYEELESSGSWPDERAPAAPPLAVAGASVAAVVLAGVYWWANRRLAAAPVACRPPVAPAMLSAVGANLLAAYLAGVPARHSPNDCGSLLPALVCAALSLAVSVALAAAFRAPCTAAFIGLAGGAACEALALTFGIAVLVKRCEPSITSFVGVFRAFEELTDQYEEEMDTEDATGLHLQSVQFLNAVAARYVWLILGLAALTAPALLSAFRSFLPSAGCLFFSPLRPAFLCTSALWSAALTGRMRAALQAPGDLWPGVGAAASLLALCWLLPGDGTACTSGAAQAAEVALGLAAALAAWLALVGVTGLHRLRRNCRTDARIRARAAAAG